MRKFLKPAPQRVLVLVEEASEKVGSIFIPNPEQQEKPKFAEVIAVGTGSEDNPMLYKPGQRIIMGQFAGTEIELNDTKYLVVNQMDIMGVIIES